MPNSIENKPIIDRRLTEEVVDRPHMNMSLASRRRRLYTKGVLAASGYCLGILLTGIGIVELAENVTDYNHQSKKPDAVLGIFAEIGLGATLVLTLKKKIAHYDDELELNYLEEDRLSKLPPKNTDI